MTRIHCQLRWERQRDRSNLNGANSTIQTIVLQPQQHNTTEGNNFELFSPSANCRICLEPCREPQYCRCRDDLKVHQKCLIEFLKKKPPGPNYDKCEICMEVFRLDVHVEYQLNWSNYCSKLSKAKCKCATYACLILLMIGYLGYFSYLISTIPEEQTLLRIITTIVAVVAVTISILFFLLCTYEFLFVLSKEIRAVLPNTGAQQRKPSPADHNLQANGQLRQGFGPTEAIVFSL